MTFSTRVRSELFTTESIESFNGMADLATSPRLIRLPLTRPFGAASKKTKKSTVEPAVSSATPENREREKPMRHGLPWLTEEHDRFLQALEIYSSGPWEDVASFIGTRTPRQVMTHAQKYRQKIQRRRRGLLTSRKIVPPSRESYAILAVTTSLDDFDPSVLTGSSPTTLDGFSRMESNLAAEEMDAALLAVLEFNDPTLFPMANDQQPATTLEFDSYIDDIMPMIP